MFQLQSNYALKLIIHEKVCHSQRVFSPSINSWSRDVAKEVTGTVLIPQNRSLNFVGAAFQPLHLVPATLTRTARMLFENTTTILILIHISTPARFKMAISLSKRLL